MPTGGLSGMVKDKSFPVWCQLIWEACPVSGINFLGRAQGLGLCPNGKARIPAHGYVGVRPQLGPKRPLSNDVGAGFTSSGFFSHARNTTSWCTQWKWRTPCDRKGLYAIFLAPLCLDRATNQGFQ